MTTLFVGQSLSGILNKMKKSGAVETNPILVCGKANGKWRVRPSNHSSRMIIDCDERTQINA